jgi:hypothetical protein
MQFRATRVHTQAPILGTAIEPSNQHFKIQRSQELARRREQRQQLELAIDSAIEEAQTGKIPAHTLHPVGCMSWLFSFVRRSRRSTAVDISLSINASELSAFQSSSTSKADSATSQSTFSNSSMSTRLFGIRKNAHAQSSPSAKLSQASQSIEARMAELKQRAQHAKQQAMAAHKAGDKTTALRMMQRAKAVDKQMTALWHALSALERQSEMLEEASLQKQVADALSVSVKKMKGSQKLLEGVDKLSDDAAEMRDISDDVRNALASISESANDPGLDDDDLMQELESMMESQSDEPELSSMAATDTSSSYLSMPSAPQGMPHALHATAPQAQVMASM